MGYYIEGAEGLDKIQWCQKYALKCWETNADIDVQHFIDEDKNGNALVCIIDNGAFFACGLAHSLEEFKVFHRPDGRLKVWISIPKIKVLEQIPSLKNYGIFKEQ